LLVHATAIALLVPLAPRPDVPPAVSVAACFAPAARPLSSTFAAPLVTEVAQLSPAVVQARLDLLVEQQEGRSANEQLERLDTASRRLTRLSSEQSLEELAGQFQSWWGYANRATEPTPAAAGPFDENTAQLHEVTRHAQPDGAWSYRCVLVDAAGRTLEVAMDEEHGRLAYELMQRMRANPLLEKLYRRIVMPLVDHWQRPPEAP